MNKIKIGSQWTSTYHRSGWGYALNALRHLHSDDGVWFDGFIDQKFGWYRDNGAPPYRQPWVGFFHHPPVIPLWFGSGLSAKHIIASTLWRESLPHCRGLFTLSNYLADWLRPQVQVPVCSLFHPTDHAVEPFSMEKYDNNERRKVIHLGWWLRKIHSFFLLRTRTHQKLLIAPISPQELRQRRPWVKALFKTERGLAALSLGKDSVIQPFKFEFYKDHESYDRLLSSNIVFIDLYDSSANNVIVECIVRNTPVIVNRHPAVIEYLGRDYPLYFDTIEEASDLVDSEGAIESSYNYLRDHPEIKERLTMEWFIREFTNSVIYRQLSS